MLSKCSKRGWLGPSPLEPRDSHLSLCPPGLGPEGMVCPQSPKLVGGVAYSLRSALSPREEPQAQGGKPRARLSPTLARNLWDVPCRIRR